MLTLKFIPLCSTVYILGPCLTLYMALVCLKCETSVIHRRCDGFCFFLNYFCKFYLKIVKHIHTAELSISQNVCLLQYIICYLFKHAIS